MVFADTVRRIVPFKWKRAVASAVTSAAIGAFIQRQFPNGVPSHGCRIPLRGSIDNRAAAKLFFNLYERAELYTIRRFLPRGGVVVELGGSLGVGTCQIAKRATRVISVEADPALAEHLKKTVSANGFTNVSVVSKALAYGSDRVAFGGESSLSGHVGGSGQSVPTITLAHLVDGLPSYALVCDIEGAEIAMLENDSKALERCTHILIEMDGGERVSDMILALGFECTYRHGRVAVFSRGHQLPYRGEVGAQPV